LRTQLIGGLVLVFIFVLGLIIFAAESWKKGRR
jgi:hypothetical protein